MLPLSSSMQSGMLIPSFPLSRPILPSVAATTLLATLLPSRNLSRKPSIVLPSWPMLPLSSSMQSGMLIPSFPWLPALEQRLAATLIAPPPLTTLSRLSRPLLTPRRRRKRNPSKSTWQLSSLWRLQQGPRRPPPPAPAHRLCNRHRMCSCTIWNLPRERKICEANHLARSHTASQRSTRGKVEYCNKV